MTDQPMTIALLGATGGVGGRFLRLALGAGHEVGALVRDPSRVTSEPGLTTLRGDPTSTDDVRAALAGAGTIVSCIGNPKGVVIMERAAAAVLGEAGRLSPLPKCLFVSSIGCGGSSWVIKQLLSLINGRKGMTDYERADERIRRERRVPWVLVRPAALNNRPGTAKYRVFQTDGTFARPIPREDVARFLYDAIGTDRWDEQDGFSLAGSK